MVPALAVAPRVTWPLTHTEPGVVDVIDRPVVIVAVTATLGDDVKVPLVAST